MSSSNNNFFRPGKQLHKFMYLGNTQGAKPAPKIRKIINQSVEDQQVQIENLEE